MKILKRFFGNNKINIISAFGVVFLFSFFIFNAQARTIEIPAQESVYIELYDGARNFSGRPYLLVSDQHGTSISCSYFKFNVTTPSDVRDLQRATLHLYAIGANGDSTTHWSIGSAAYNWSSATATWNHQPSSSGDDTYKSSHAIPVHTGAIDLDVTHLVEGWLNGDLDMAKGMGICDPVGGNVLMTLKKNSSTDLHLTIDYQEPIGDGGMDEIGSVSEEEDDEMSTEEITTVEPIILITPVDQATINTLQPTFRWTKAEEGYDIGEFKIIVKRKADGEKIIHKHFSADVMSYVPENNMTLGKYEWYVEVYWNDEMVYKTKKNDFEIVSTNIAPTTPTENSTSDIAVSSNTSSPLSSDISPNQSVKSPTIEKNNIEKSTGAFWWLGLGGVLGGIITGIIYWFLIRQKKKINKDKNKK